MGMGNSAPRAASTPNSPLPFARPMRRRRETSVFNTPDYHSGAADTERYWFFARMSFTRS